MIWQLEVPGILALVSESFEMNELGVAEEEVVKAQFQCSVHPIILRCRQNLEVCVTNFLKSHINALEAISFH